MTIQEILERQRGLIEDLQEMIKRSTPNPRHQQIADDLLETNEQLSAIATPAAIDPPKRIKSQPAPAASVPTAAIGETSTTTEQAKAE